MADPERPDADPDVGPEPERPAPDELTSAQPRRRANDRLRPKDIVYLAGLALVVAALIVAWRSDVHSARADRHAASADAHAANALAKVQQGRATSLAVTCAVESAVSEAGRAVIGSSRDTAFTRALERLPGFPSLTERRAEGKRAGELYVETISNRVDAALREQGKPPIKGLVRKNGTIDCKVLSQVAKVPKPR